MLELWGGVVLAESVLELFARARPELRRAVATLHYCVDLFVELPLLAAVVGSGAALLRGRVLDGALAVKVAFGLAAVAANAVCVGLVIARHRGTEEGLARRSRVIVLTAVAGLPCAAVAFFLGKSRAGLIAP